MFYTLCVCYAMSHAVWNKSYDDNNDDDDNDDDTVYTLKLCSTAYENALQ